MRKSHALVEKVRSVRFVAPVVPVAVDYKLVSRSDDDSCPHSWLLDSLQRGRAFISKIIA
jgi:hypothetical protein